MGCITTVLNEITSVYLHLCFFPLNLAYDIPFFILVFLILKNLNKIRLRGFTTGKLLHDKAAAKSSNPVLSSATSYKFMSPFYGDMSILAAKNWPIFSGTNMLIFLHVQSDE